MNEICYKNMFLLGLFAIILSLVAYFLYLYKKAHRSFDSGGLKYLPGVPIFGNKWRSLLLLRHYIYDLDEVYNAFPDERYVGFIDGVHPTIFVRDPEMVNIIAIKDFDHFQNRKDAFQISLDEILIRNLDQIEGEEWKTIRRETTPGYTASRIRHMLPAMLDACGNIIKAMKDSPSKDMDIKYFVSRYAGDATLAAAFGFNRERAGLEESIFIKLGGTIVFTWWERVLIFLSLQSKILRDILKSLGYHVFTKKFHYLIRDCIRKSFDYRRKHNISTHDVMDIYFKKSEGRSINDFAGQIFFAFLASFETAANLVCVCFLELIYHPDIQERLYQEIRKHEEECGQMTMDGISGLKYLDCVFKEVARKWSPAVMMDRVCTKTYTLPPPRDGGKPYLVKPGTVIYVGVNNIHMDPKHHPDPENFDPERFSDENRSKIKPFTFLTFGKGPRNCIGARLIILVMKVIIYHVLLNFKLGRCAKTPDKIVLVPDDLTLTVEGGFWLKLEPRF